MYMAIRKLPKVEVVVVQKESWNRVREEYLRKQKEKANAK